MTAAVYLSTIEAADRIGMERATFNSHRNKPPPDAIIGASTGRPVKGWLPSTIDMWNANRTRRKPPPSVASTSTTM